MESDSLKTVTLKIGGMTCINCQNKIESALNNLSGVKSAEVSWQKNRAWIQFDPNLITLKKIILAIEESGYKAAVTSEKTESQVGKLQALKTAGYLFIITALFLILRATGVMNLLVPSEIASSGMSYALLFVTGLLTSVHCVAMCGGINLSQSLNGAGQKERSTKEKSFFEPYKKPFLYNLGRLTCYTLTGLVLGGAGFFIGSSDPSAQIPFSIQAVLKITAGIFMLVAGISLLGIFPFLRRLSPHLPAFLAKKIIFLQGRNGISFLTGFLNGFMPCGPLQAMWIIALASSSPLSGAVSMFAFGLGTVPLMLGLGSLVSFLGKKFTGVIMKTGAVLVIVMALSMLSQGFALGGWGNSSSGSPADRSAQNVQQTQKKQDKNIEIQDGKQVVKSVLNPYRYPSITVKKGIPVHWEIEAEKDALNGCNYRMVFRDFNFQYQMGYGTNVIEFTPQKTGNFQYTCWMGMIYGTVNVIE